jgi:hypothetical protein
LLVTRTPLREFAGKGFADDFFGLAVTITWCEVDQIDPEHLDEMVIRIAGVRMYLWRAALSEQFLHVAVAQRKAEIEPDRVLDDLGRKTMAAKAARSHAATLTLRAALARPVSVTKPRRRYSIPIARAAVPRFSPIRFLAHRRGTSFRNSP